MILWQSWRDSLTLFIPANFKLFGLVTLKSMIDSYKILVKYFWWFMAFVVFGAPYMGSVLGKAPQHPVWVMLALSIVFFGWSFIVVLSTRPSVEQKKCAYFRDFLVRYGLVIVFNVVLALVGIIVVTRLFFELLVVTLSVDRVVDIVSFLVLNCGIAFAWLLMWYILYLLFLFDTGRGIAGVVTAKIRATKMLWYNAPFFVVIGAVWTVLQFYVLSLLRYDVLYIVANMIVLQVLVCFVTNFYIKKIHEQSKLYFKRS